MFSQTNLTWNFWNSVVHRPFTIRRRSNWPIRNFSREVLQISRRYIDKGSRSFYCIGNLLLSLLFPRNKFYHTPSPVVLALILRPCRFIGEFPFFFFLQDFPSFFFWSVRFIANHCRTRELPNFLALPE